MEIGRKRKSNPIDPKFRNWFQLEDGPPQIVEANIGYYRSNAGGTIPVVAEVDYTNGNITILKVNRLPLVTLPYEGPRDPIISLNASGTISNGKAFNSINPSDLEKVITSVKRVAYDLNSQFATDGQQTTLRKSKLYRPIANELNTPPPKDQEGGQPPPPPESTGSSGGDPARGDPELTTIKEITEVSGKEYPQRQVVTESGGIFYPEKMPKDNDVIRFTAVRIKPRKTTGNSQEKLGFTFGKPEYEKKDGPVYLPIHAPISDQNSVDWGPESVNALDAFAFGFAMSFLGNANEDIAAKIAEGVSKAQETAKSQDKRLIRYLGGQAANINNVLPRTDNVVLNPNMELLFQGPQLRPFTFTFKLSARRDTEADKIKQIIKFFKYNMAPRMEQDKLFLRAPHVFTIEYLKRDKGGNFITHNGINLISLTKENKYTKACALTNCSVDYTPLGSYMTYTDGTMVSYTINLQFQEIEPIYDNDYVDNWNHPIGF